MGQIGPDLRIVAALVEFSAVATRLIGQKLAGGGRFVFPRRAGKERLMEPANPLVGRFRLLEHALGTKLLLFDDERIVEER